ncbi:hypothetical protein PFISCL1PPCAC_18143, partial [Pristionchus fissidentatus]
PILILAMSKRKREEDKENDCAVGNATDQKRTKFNENERISLSHDVAESTELETIVDKIVEQIVNNEQMNHSEEVNDA